MTRPRAVFVVSLKPTDILLVEVERELTDRERASAKRRSEKATGQKVDMLDVAARVTVIGEGR